jgi:hypothetical protein
MKDKTKSNIMISSWALTGIGILILNLYAGVAWVLSSYILRDIIHNSKKGEKNEK